MTLIVSQNGGYTFTDPFIPSSGICGGSDRRICAFISHRFRAFPFTARARSLFRRKAKLQPTQIYYGSYNRDMTRHALTEFLCSLSFSLFLPLPLALSHSILPPCPTHSSPTYIHSHSHSYSYTVCHTRYMLVTLKSGILRIAVADQCGRQAGTSPSMGYRAWASSSHHASSLFLFPISVPSRLFLACFSLCLRACLPVISLSGP